MRSLFLPKCQPKISQISALPSNKPPGQKSEKFLVGILGEMMTSEIHSEFNWPLPLNIKKKNKFCLIALWDKRVKLKSSKTRKHEKPLKINSVYKALIKKVIPKHKMRLYFKTFWRQSTLLNRLSLFSYTDRNNLAYLQK